MFTILLFVVAIPLLIRSAYMLGVSAWAWTVPLPAVRGSRLQRFVVVVPAHNEERVIARLVGDLDAQDYPKDQYSIWVIADRCEDGTAKIAAEAGANVVERSGEAEGKGAVLAWFVHEHSLETDDALVVLDADNRVPSDLLTSFADEIEAGNSVLQAYLDVANPDESKFALASALSYWSAARLVQLPRRNLGWSCQLGGTGMCLTGEALEQAGGYGHSLTEDRDLELRVVEAGGRVTWLHHLHVRDEKPTSADLLTQQRARWATGKRTNRSVHAAVLLRRSMSGSLASLDRLLDLVFPSRILSFVLLAAVLAIAVATIGVQWWVTVGLIVLAIDVVAVVASLLAERVPLKRILQLPLLALFALIWVPVQVASRSQVGWFSTPHSGSEEDHSAESVAGE